MRVVNGGGLTAWLSLFVLLMGLSAYLATPALALTPHITSEVDSSRCAACHSAHRATGPLLLNTVGGSTGTCYGCHAGSNQSASNVVTGPVDSFGLPSGHSFATETSGTVQIAGCETCHDIHGSSAEKRRIPARMINGVEVTAAGNDLCIACHESSETWYGPDYPSTSAPSRDETGYPVAGRWPGPVTYESTSSAHRLIPSTTQTVGISEPVLREQGDCLYCHSSHGGVNAYDGLTATYTVPATQTLDADKTEGSYAALCFTCHGGQTPSGFTTQTVDIKQFATAPGGSGGHSIVTSGGTLPVGAPLPCFECHNPHGSKRDNASLLSDERGGSLSTTGAANVRQFCFTCHATSDTVSGWDSTDEAYVTVTSADKVVGLPRDGGVLLLPADIVGHTENDPESCYECHGDSYETGGNNVHNPGSGLTEVEVVELSPSFMQAYESTETTTAGTSAETTETVGFESDVTPPITTSDAQATYDGTATINLRAVDETGGSGVYETYYQLEGSDTATGTVVTTTTVGAHTLTFWSVDNAGNVEVPTVVEFTVLEEQTVSMLGLTTSRLGRWIDLGGT